MKILITFLVLIMSTQGFASFDETERKRQFEAVQANRNILDPIVLGMSGIEGSMIGGCIQGSDKDPFFEMSPEERQSHTLIICLVYLSKDANIKSQVLLELAERGMTPSVQIRIQPPFGKLEEQ